MSTLHHTVRAAVHQLVAGLEQHAVADPATWQRLWCDPSPRHLVPRRPRAVPDRPDLGVTDLAAGTATWRPTEDEPIAAWLQLELAGGRPQLAGRAIDVRGRAVTVPIAPSAGIAEWAAHIPNPQA
ncbi:hypothetical protein [Dietzia sp. 179-F 9C3 NHS]|uniref:hypothetical protein n=1 Tax=Dietzia sp. 179-F 9C3 NHS TaxID=3374295 RepID=UPI00387A7063